MTNTKPIHENRFGRMSRGLQIAVVCGVCLSVFLILFGVAEAAVRVRAWIKHGQSVVRIEDSYRRDEKTGLRLPRPGFSTSRLTINSLGFRSPEISIEKPAQTYRIAFLGASTTYSADVSGEEKTWPHLVVKALEDAHPHRSFEYINAGVPGFTTHDSLVRFEVEVGALDPDLVVIYHATNDLSGNSRASARAQGLSGAAESKTLSWLSKWSLFVYLVEKNLRIIALQQATDDASNKMDVDAAALAIPFETSLRELVRTVQASGAKVALVTFATRLHAAQTPEEQIEAALTALYYMPYMTPAGLIESFNAYNDVIRKVAREEGAIVVEAAKAVPGDVSQFIDSVHFTELGSSTMANVVASVLRSETR